MTILFLTKNSFIKLPTYATLVMKYLELQFYEKCKNEFGVNNGKYIEENWHRFLDDCYIALDATNINPLKRFDMLNNIHDNLTFMTISNLQWNKTTAIS